MFEFTPVRAWNSRGNLYEGSPYNRKYKGTFKRTFTSIEEAVKYIYNSKTIGIVESNLTKNEVIIFNYKYLAYDRNQCKKSESQSKGGENND